MREIIFHCHLDVYKRQMGIAEAGNRKRPCETDIVHGRLLPMGSDENMRCQGNFKGKTVKGGTRKLFGLL